jgi:hypothetical protein
VSPLQQAGLSTAHAVVLVSIKQLGIGTLGLGLGDGLGLGLGLGLGRALVIVGLVHTRATHVQPAAHALLQPPQWLGSVDRRTHTASRAGQAA